MLTASIPVNFKLIAKIRDELWNRPRHGMYNSHYLDYERTCIYSTPEGSVTFTFKDAAAAEDIRRQIESHQLQLSKDAQVVGFEIRYIDGASSTHAPTGALPFMREALVKWTSLKIVKLLDEATALGVDVSENKKVLAEFLDNFKVGNST